MPDHVLPAFVIAMGCSHEHQFSQTFKASRLQGFINAVDPGYTATDLNGHSGFKTVEQGAAIFVDMAQVAPDGPTGGFFSDQGPVPW